MTSHPLDKPHPATSKLTVSIIIPTYQAETFITQSLKNLTAYANRQPAIQEIILVDDGSQDQTSQRIQTYLEKHPRSCIQYLTLNHNVGKGAAIKAGLKNATGDLILFTDCDLPYAFSDIDALISVLTQEHVDIAIGNRMHPKSIYHIRSHNLSYIYVRHTSGRLFNFLINLLTRLHLSDTQAGLKGFTRASANCCFDKMTVSGFAFDIDLLVCAQKNKLHIETVPLNFNYDSEMSTISFLKHALFMTASVLQIVLKKFTGYYTRT